MNESWKFIRDTNNHYMISNLGNVKSMERFVSVCGGGKRLVREKILKKTLDNRGYHVVRLGTLGKSKNSLVHRLVASEFIPNPESKHQVNHLDGVKTNNHIDNLEWCTAAENIKHAIDSGLNRCVKELHGRSKLKQADIDAIKTINSKDKISYSQIAFIFDISLQMVERIVNEKNWNKDR